MTKYSRCSLIFAVATCLGGLVGPLTSAAPAPSSSGASAGVEQNAGVRLIAVDNNLCQKTGERLLKGDDYNAVDVAVAVTLCLGVVNFQSSGIGGAMVMVVAKKGANGGEPNVTIIDSRAVAPLSVTQGTTYTRSLAQRGPSSIAVPGELKGMQLALEWFSEDSKSKREVLFEDAISYAEKGFKPSNHLLNAVQSAIVDSNTTSHSFNDNQTQSAKWFSKLKSLVQVDGRYIREGDNVPPRPMLNETLRTIMEFGFDEFYTGSIATKLVSDFREDNACAARPDYCRGLRDIVTAADLSTYPLRLRAPFKFQYGNNSGYDVYTAPAPYSGSALAVFLGIVTRRVNKDSSEDNVYHYLTEAAKFSASRRMKLGDPEFSSSAEVTPAMAEADIQAILAGLDANAKARPADDLRYYGFKMGQPEEGMGTTHLSVIKDDMAVSVTSSINDFFGSGYMSASTGVLYSNGMAAFSILPDEIRRFPFNQIEARKRPLSAKCPTVVIAENGDFKLVTGAAGGVKIPPAVGQTMFYALTRGTSAKEASCQPRVYAQLGANEVSIKQLLEMSENPDIPGFPSNSETLRKLRDDHCQIYTKFTDLSEVQSILEDGGTYTAHSDVRKYGGKCGADPNWAFHPSVKLLLIFLSFVLQYVCISMLQYS